MNLRRNYPSVPDLTPPIRQTLISLTNGVNNAATNPLSNNLEAGIYSLKSTTGTAFWMQLNASSAGCQLYGDAKVVINSASSVRILSSGDISMTAGAAMNISAGSININGSAAYSGTISFQDGALNTRTISVVNGIITNWV